ncbi:MAG: ribonuclease III [Sulfuricurvum sp.]|jgi:ribonuclease III|uniref:ribonuclease III n=1 Tax=Sulfuricurvum sp. TaxID=2025608 RepID=UPI00261530D4|nr:ribonuclease III [Sulfuricurvum sp.]MDD2829534.1 ribonuclease III [Sulfuricurvum sp.]MDD4950466.1 ribonuclease III [Sulfuricurvum sp.]
MNDLQTLQQRLGYQFHNTKLLIEALTHKSHKQPYNNERLEFLGDAVLDLVVGEYLYKKFPKFDEGDLSKMRASLVNEDGFTLLANHLHLGEYIFLSNAEENNNGRNKSSLLANAFEAVMGAIYLESGLETVRNITVEFLELVHEDISLNSLFKDYKTSLQELTQAHFGITPDYQLIASHGPDHKKEFEVAAFIDGKRYASALGKSKKQAQQEAAKIALDILSKELK